MIVATIVLQEANSYQLQSCEPVNFREISSALSRQDFCPSIGR